MAFEFTHRLRVEFADTDMAGIVHFANFYRYMEVAEHEFYRSLGLGLMLHEPDGAIVSWPRVSASCSFRAPARYDDLLDVQLRVERKGVKSVTYQFRLTRTETDGAVTEIAVGQMKTVCCRFRPGRPLESIEIPPHFGDKIEEAPT